MELDEDSDCRYWRTKQTNDVVMYSEIWGSLNEGRNESEEPYGYQLQATKEFVIKFLNRICMDLVLEVGIQRSIRRQPYESYDSDEFGYFPPYTRIFILRRDGEIYSL